MDLMGKAAEIGVTVTTGELPEGWWGSWNHHTRTITLLEGLGVVQRRSVLAHELGHAVHNHKGTTPENEAEARVWAARALIHPARAAATAKRINWLGLIAKELGVLPEDIAAYYQSLTDEERLCIRGLAMMEPQGFGRWSNAAR
jgi:Zn-dependent peptidase ImmA (M78 family)